MKTFGIVSLLLLLTGLVIPVPTVFLDLLFIIEIPLIIFFIFISKSKNISKVIKYTIVVCQYSLFWNIWSLRLLLTHGKYFRSSIINILMVYNYFDNTLFFIDFYKYYIGLFVLISFLIITFVIYKILYCKNELNLIIFQNKIVNKRTGESIYVKDGNIREVIIAGYNNIVKFNIIILLYIIFNILITIVVSKFLDITTVIHGEETFFYYSKSKAIVIGNIFVIFIGFFSFILNGIILEKQKKYIENNVYSVRANCT
jgi:hypothetical protein